MAFNLAWAAVRIEQLDTLCDALDLDPTATTAPQMLPAEFAAIALDTGFGAVVDGTRTRLTRPEDIAALSRRVGSVIQMIVHESVGVQVLGEWREGAPTWQVIRTHGQPLQRNGAVPAEVLALLSNPTDDSLTRAAEALVGLRHDATAQPSAHGFRLMRRRWDAHLRHIATREETQSLDLADSDVSDAGLAQLTGSPHLQRVVLNNTRVTTAGVAALGILPALSSLSLVNLAVDDGVVGFLCGLSRLKRLELQGAQLTDAGVAAVARPPLRSLSLSGAAISARSLTALAAVPTLDYLGLSDVPLDPELLQAVAQSPSLEVVSLWNAPVADLPLLAPLPRLRRVIREGTFLEGAALDDALGRPPKPSPPLSLWKRLTGWFGR